MTDHRGSKQGLWDEEVDGDRPTNPGLDVRPTNPKIDSQVAAHADSDDLPTDTELDSAIELIRMTIPPVEVEPASTAASGSPSGTMSPEAIDSVARFISDPGIVSHNRELDAPRRSLEAIELLDAEYGAEPTDMRAPPQPPPPPGSVRPSHDEDLPSIVLGAQVSTRADQTERTRAIPATHPLANSIAPGGSAVSTPPRPRRNSRWQVALGVAALIAIGFGSRFLQSRGEHHAASGLPGEDQEEEVVTRREEPVAKPSEEELAARQVAEAEAARQAEAEAEAARLSQAQADAQRLADEEAARQKAQADEQARSAKVTSTAKKGKSMRIAVGGVRMLERDEAEVTEEGGPDRAKVIAAMNAMTDRLKGCVGDEHGVADVTLTVRAPGVVSHALVEGAFADSPQGTCIARALRTAKLPEFADPVTRIEYPFQL